MTKHVAKIYCGICAGMCGLDVTLDALGCPVQVQVNDLNNFPSLPESTRCLADALATQRWSCPAGPLTFHLGFGSCTN